MNNKGHRSIFPHVMQCAAVKTQLGAIRLPPQVGKKDSNEIYDPETVSVNFGTLARDFFQSCFKENVVNDSLAMASCTDGPLRPPPHG